MKSETVLRLIGALCASAIACGCADAFKAPYPAKAYFLIDPGHPGAEGVTTPAQPAMPAALDVPPTPRRLEGVLKVRQFQVAAPYDGSAFVYKVGPNQYSSDYYSAFLIATGHMLSADACDWLNRSHLFAHVIDASTGVRARYTLEGNISACYADFTDRQHPVAVLEAQFFLLSDGDSGPSILFQRSYSASGPITGNGPAPVVNAWNRAYRTLLEKLTADFRGIDPAKGETIASDSGSAHPQ
jgi:hypothetical protein